jgi:NADH-quinone oxidoreductase subunit G
MSAEAKSAVETVNIEVDGIAMEVPKNSMIIEATDRAGIEVPRFCYHRKLSIAANCRMCLVDVEKAPKPLPACATPVMEGMKVYTRSRRAIDAQHAVMEFLLINHPLDCPICDQGGECELQDLAMGYGRSVSRFTERKRVVKDKNVGPLIQTDMTRCIHCTRCIRFLEEIAGTSEMGGTGRGDRLEIGTCIERSIESELSGNIIDLCPVGALTDKPFRFSARAWEMLAKPATAAHDAVGSSLYYHRHSLKGRVMRAVPRDNEACNETWLSDRDRYSHFGLYADDRVLAPRVKAEGEWRDVGWEEGIQAAAGALKATVEEHGPDALGVLMSSSAATEEYFLAQRLARGLGCGHIDHRLREQDFADDTTRPTTPRFEMAIADMENADAVLLVGSDIRREAPILGHRVRKAWRKGGSVTAIRMRNADFTFDLRHDVVAPPQDLVNELSGVAAALAATGAEPAGSIGDLVAAARPGDVHRAIAEQLRDGGRSLVFLGQAAMSHHQAGALRELARWIADATGSKLNCLPHGGNPVGAWLAGAVPHRGPGGAATESGLSASQMLGEPRKTYLLWDFEPEFDTADPAGARAALEAADRVVAVTAFATDEMAEVADVILPLAPWPENEGTLHNIDGATCPVAPAGRMSGACKAGWKILRRLGGELALAGFGQVDIDAVRSEMDREVQGEAARGEVPRFQPVPSTGGLYRIGEVPMYSVDALCRRSGPLQTTSHADSRFVGLNPEDARNLGLAGGDMAGVSQGGPAVELEVQISEGVPAGAAWVKSATCSARPLGAAFGPISVEKA